VGHMWDTFYMRFSRDTITVGATYVLRAVGDTVTVGATCSECSGHVTRSRHTITVGATYVSAVSAVCAMGTV
jgi:hypothetical protein